MQAHISENTQPKTFYMSLYSTHINQILLVELFHYCSKLRMKIFTESINTTIIIRRTLILTRHSASAESVNRLTSLNGGMREDGHTSQQEEEILLRNKLFLA